MRRWIGLTLTGHSLQSIFCTVFTCVPQLFAEYKRPSAFRGCYNKQCGHYLQKLFNHAAWSEIGDLLQQLLVRPAPATEQIGNMYGGQWWLVPDNRDDVALNLNFSICSFIDKSFSIYTLELGM